MVALQPTLQLFGTGGGGWPRHAISSTATAPLAAGSARLERRRNMLGASIATLDHHKVDPQAIAEAAERPTLHDTKVDSIWPRFLRGYELHPRLDIAHKTIEGLIPRSGGGCVLPVRLPVRAALSRALSLPTQEQTHLIRQLTRGHGACVLEALGVHVVTHLWIGGRGALEGGV